MYALCWRSFTIVIIMHHWNYAATGDVVKYFIIIWKLDHFLSSCIVEVVYVVKVVIIVCSQRCWRPSRRLDSDDWESEWLSTSTATGFEASITEKNSIAQYSFRTSDGTLLMVCAGGYLYNIISTGLRQPREHVKFGHRCSSEKATRCL